MAAGLTARDIQKALEDELGVHKNLDLIAHVGYEKLGPIQDGPETVAGGILAAAGTVVMPSGTMSSPSASTIDSSAPELCVPVRRAIHSPSFCFRVTRR